MKSLIIYSLLTLPLLSSAKVIRCGGFMEDGRPSFEKIQLKLDYKAIGNRLISSSAEFLNTSTRERFTLKCTDNRDSSQLDFTCRPVGISTDINIWARSNYGIELVTLDPNHYGQIEIGELFCSESWVQGIMDRGEWELD